MTVFAVKGVRAMDLHTWVRHECESTSPPCVKVYEAEAVDAEVKRLQFELSCWSKEEAEIVRLRYYLHQIATAGEIHDPHWAGGIARKAFAAEMLPICITDEAQLKTLLAKYPDGIPGVEMQLPVDNGTLRHE